jgi:hypothetical protein
MHVMDAKAIVLTSMLVAIAAPGAASNATGPTESAGGDGKAARNPGRADHEHDGAGHVRDDYAAALAQARRRGVPILVDVWAPW